MIECTVCGPLPWRGGEHADWCDDIRAFLRQDARQAECHCGKASHARGMCDRHYRRWLAAERKVAS